MRKIYSALAGALLLLSTGAQALSFNFSVDVSGGSLAGAYTGAFSYTDPAPADGTVGLDTFTFDFNSNTFSEADDPFASAWFESGSFVGIDFFFDNGVDFGFSFSPGDLATPIAPSFAYTLGADIGTGNPIFTLAGPAAVPEPGTWLGSLLAVAIGFAARRRQAGNYAPTSA